MPLKLKEKSLDEMKKDAISGSVAERGYKNGGKVMKPCSGCSSPAKCKAAGKCMGKGYKMGGHVLVKGKNC
jgi:hypothetical protein